MPKRIEHKPNGSCLLTVSGGYIGTKQKLYRKTVYLNCPPNCSDAERNTAAEIEYTIFEAECLRGKVKSNLDKTVTLKEFYNYWMKNHVEKTLSENSLNYYNHISRRVMYSLGKVKMENISPTMCITFINGLSASKQKNGQKLSSETVKKHYFFLKELFSFAYKWDIVTKNPLEKLDPPKVNKEPKVMPPEKDVAELLDAAMKSQDEQLQLWIILAFAMGYRREEIFGLKISDIDLKEKTISINKAATYISKKGVSIGAPKSRASKRKTIMPDIVCDMMASYIKKLRSNTVIHPEGWLFVKNNKIMSPPTFNNRLKKLCEENELQNITPHTLRHLYGSNLIKQGVDLAITSHQLGHSKKSFTADTYIHITEQLENRAAVAIQNAINNMLDMKKS